MRAMLLLLALLGLFLNGCGPDADSEEPAPEEEITYPSVKEGVSFRIELPASTDGELAVTLANLSTDSIEYRDASVARDFSFHIWDGQGNELWSPLYTKNPGSFMRVLRNVPCTLDAGQTTVWYFPLPDIYPFESSKQYMFMVRRYVLCNREWFYLKSRTIVFDVQADGRIDVVDANATHPPVSEKSLCGRALDGWREQNITGAPDAGSP